MRTLICGGGEIGRALLGVLSCYEPKAIDLDSARNVGRVKRDETFDIVHIAFPYGEGFEAQVETYKECFKPKYVVVHSTVPIGVNRRLGSISSPIIGIHPDLEESLRTFTKFLGGPKASECADYFRRAGIKVYLFDKSETPELMKILDTTFYGVCIEYTKDVKKQCDRFGIPFEAWTIWTSQYNSGYSLLGHPEFTRPNLVPIMKKVGAHCLLPNCELLDTVFTRLVKKLNGESSTSMQKQKPLKCKVCGHKVGVVKVRPVFRRKLLIYALAIAFVFQFVSQLIVDVILR